VARQMWAIVYGGVSPTIPSQPRAFRAGSCDHGPGSGAGPQAAALSKPSGASAAFGPSAPQSTLRGGRVERAEIPTEQPTAFTGRRPDTCPRRQRLLGRVARQAGDLDARAFARGPAGSLSSLRPLTSSEVGSTVARFRTARSIASSRLSVRPTSTMAESEGDALPCWIWSPATAHSIVRHVLPAVGRARSRSAGRPGAPFTGEAWPVPRSGMRRRRRGRLRRASRGPSFVFGAVPILRRSSERPGAALYAMHRRAKRGPPADASAEGTGRRDAAAARLDPPGKPMVRDG
jgi:hypothetical protein